MSTSASITNNTVSMRSLPERPSRKRRAPSFASAAAESGEEDGSAMSLPKCKTLSCRYPPKPREKSSTEAAQQNYDALHQSIGRSRQEIVQRRALANLCARRVRQYHTGKCSDVEVLADRQAPGADKLARLRPHNGGAQDSASSRGNHLDVPARLSLGLGAVIFPIGPAQHLNGIAAVLRLRPRVAQL